MDFIPSTSLSDVVEKNLVNILNDRATCNYIGRMIFLNMAINNWDRLNYQAANTGNLMIPDEPDADGRRPIALIDHQMNLNTETLPIVQQRLEQLINGNGSERIAHAVISKLLQSTIADTDGLIAAIPKYSSLEEKEKLQGGEF